jgi:hypothetical protein
MVVVRNQWRIGSERETAVGRVKPMEEDMGGGGRRWRWWSVRLICCWPVRKNNQMEEME